MSQKQAEKLAIEAHASYLIINSIFEERHINPESRDFVKVFFIREKAANRLYRRYNLAYGK